MWHVMGVMLAAGGSFRWYRDTLGETEKNLAKMKGIDAYDLLTEAAAKIPAGAEHLFFLPYLSGERTPYPDPNARGVFFGLNLKHTKAHMTRAVLEGVSFGLRDSLELIRAMRIPIRQIRVVGGGARSQLWRQILADVFEQPIYGIKAQGIERRGDAETRRHGDSRVAASPRRRVHHFEGAAFGAALLAGVGAGAFV
jgi:xylulokinase